MQIRPRRKELAMQTRNPNYAACLVITVVLALSFAGCGGGDADSASPSQTATEPAVDAGGAADVAPAGDESLRFDDVPEIAGYEITEQDQKGKELYVNLRSDVSEDQAMKDFTDWALGDGWTALDADWPGIDLVFEKSDRVYPLKVSVFPQLSTGGVEILVIMPAVGDKLGDW